MREGCKKKVNKFHPFLYFFFIFFSHFVGVGGSGFLCHFSSAFLFRKLSWRKRKIFCTRSKFFDNFYFFLAVTWQLYRFPCDWLPPSLLVIVEKHYHRALWETCDPWDMLSERWGDMTWTTTRQWQWQWQWQWYLENTSQRSWWGDMTWLTKRQRHLENKNDS